MWSMGERYVPAALQIISTLILTRMILPSDFAEVALISVIIELLTLIISSGLADGLIYNNRNSNLLYSTVFYANIGLAISLYSLLVLSGGFISNYYGIPRLRVLIYVVGLNLIFHALSYIHRTMYTVNLNFKTPAQIVFISTIIGCVVGLILAFNNFGVWAIVFQTLTINASQAVLFWANNKWRPILNFSWKEIKIILPFSIRVFLNNLLQSVYDNIYTLLLGKYQPAKFLGYYNRMQSVVYFATKNLSYSLGHVYYPMLSKIKENVDEVRKKYLMISRIITYISFPILVILIGSGYDIILLVLTEKWVGGYNVLCFLCFAYFFMPCIFINDSYLKVLNQTKTLFYTGIMRKVFGITILMITITTNMTIILHGIIVTFFIEWMISSICISKYLNISVIKQITNIFSNIFVNCIALLLIAFINKQIDFVYLRLLVSLSVAMSLYALWPITLKTKVYNDIKALINK